MEQLFACLGLFATALAAGSLLPMPSEAALVGLLLASPVDPWILVATATAGNVVGSTVNWLLGVGAARYQDRSWFPVSPDRLAKARGWYHRYGRWTLLISWVPIIGDPLTVAAGLMREPLWSFLMIVSLAKFVRYATLAGVTLHLV
jgi:membrane protein YqaA with SNARE-associated domain